MNIYTKFYDNLSNGGLEILLKITNLNFMLALEEKPEDHQNH